MIKSEPDANFVIITNTLDYQKLLNTYVTEENVAWLNASVFEDYLSENTEKKLTWDEAFKNIPCQIFEQYYKWNNVDYIIWDNVTETTYELGKINEISANKFEEIISNEDNSKKQYGTPMTIDESGGELSMIGKDLNVFHIDDSSYVPSINFEFVPSD